MPSTVTYQSRHPVLVRLDEAELPEWENIVHHLEAEGLEDARFQPDRGTATGTISAAHLSHLLALPGVKALEQAAECNAGPPNPAIPLPPCE